MPITKDDFLEFLKTDECKDLINEDGIKDTIEELTGTKGLTTKNRELLIKLKKIKDKMKSESLFKENEYEEYKALKEALETQEGENDNDNSNNDNSKTRKELAKITRELDKMRKDFETVIEEKDIINKKYQDKIKTEKVNEILEKFNVSKTHRQLLKKAWMQDVVLSDDELYVKHNNDELPINEFAEDFFKDSGKVYIDKPVNAGGNTVQTQGAHNKITSVSTQQQINDLRKNGKFLEAMALMDKLAKETNK